MFLGLDFQNNSNALKWFNIYKKIVVKDAFNVSSIFTRNFDSILILLNFYFFRYIAKIAPGLKDERIAFLTNSFFFLLPAIAFLIPFGFICSYLKSYKNFDIVFQLDLFSNILILILIIFFISYEYVLFWSYSIAVLLSFLIGYLYLKQRYSLVLGSPINSDVKSLLPLVPKLFFLQASQYLFVFTDRIFVSYLESGTISALAYATTLMLTIPAVIGVAMIFCLY